MPTGDAEQPRPSFGKGRLEAFSDGVFAIAITLLVLDIVVHPPGSPLEQVLNAWPAYLTYIISFFAIGAAWIDHTALTERLERSDSVFLRLNLLCCSSSRSFRSRPVSWPRAKATWRPSASPSRCTA
jgi:uncharacterized membrane protein